MRMPRIGERQPFVEGRATGKSWPRADIRSQAPTRGRFSSDQLDPVIQLVEAEMVDACLECHASVSVLCHVC